MHTQTTLLKTEDTLTYTLTHLLTREANNRASGGARSHNSRNKKSRTEVIEIMIVV
jgi:hypothetical protein